MPNPTVTLSPNSTTRDENWTPTSGTLHGVTSDGSDASYATPASSSSTMYMQLGMTTSTTPLANGSQIRGVTPKARIRTASHGLKIAIIAGSTSAYNAFGVDGTDHDVVGTKYVKAPNGSVWTQALIDAIQLKFRSDNVTNTRVIEASIEIEYNERPVVDVQTVPVDTAMPTVTWTYTDPEADEEERFRVKIFSAAQYGAGGFDPDTSTAVYDSGEVFTETGELTHTITTSLTNGTTYRAYVKAADVGSSGRYSAWDYDQFTVAITPPSAPTVVATEDDTNARVELDITEGSDPPATTYFEVQRSVDGGTTWEFIRDGAEVTNTGGPSGITIYDYEMPRGIAVQYRARGVLVSGANTLTSAYSTTDSATVVARGFWLKSATDPTKNLRIYLTTKKWQLESVQDKGIHKGLGRSSYQVRSGQIHDFTGVLELYVRNASQYGLLTDLREEASVLLQTPYGESGSQALQMWVSFGETLSVVMVTTGGPYQRRDISIPFVTVEEPE